MAPVDLRPMTPQDLDAVLALQANGYPPALHDSADAFLSRMALAPDLNLVAYLGDGLAGYLVSHPWDAGAPPPVDARLTPPDLAACWYVHDLSVADSARGLGLGLRLLRQGRDRAMALGLRRSELVAVEGAGEFWRRLGWIPPSPISQDLAAKVASYGPAAAFMTLDDLSRL
ncbi:MAG: GNAT family N-acetyltransferase [Phenylobacterium sp.]|uniref:GNAT family N-acetyltransferase n=1 Tax=Phenylobacterium sp. TaxID=1871053 RepID=UPI0025EC1047|nr:GNAT family N-acetyltransferase [Phenylobacterium sp.]MCG9915101.1 GNAT family N-acetyltransferase [Phenylobacterium sp.]